MAAASRLSRVSANALAAPFSPMFFPLYFGSPGMLSTGSPISIWSQNHLCPYSLSSCRTLNPEVASTSSCVFHVRCRPGIIRMSLSWVMMTYRES